MPEIQPMVVDDETAKALTIAIVKLCFRSTCLEDYHAGEPNWADLIQDPQATIIHPGGVIPLSEVRRLGQVESRALRREAADALYTMLLNLRDPEYLAAVVNYGRQGLQRWDEPKPDLELQVIQSHRDDQIPEILLGEWMSAKLAFGIVKSALDCEEMSALETGVEPESPAGDYSDVKVVCHNKHIPWQEVGRISSEEAQYLSKRWADRIYTILSQLHDGKFLVIMLRLGAEVETQEEAPQVIPYLADARMLRHRF